ncbi:MAG: hypothetical protein JNK48_25360 [Bryobacterales bacterium]|nr:hypothetical protein [Bryobacterales bacterium]
MMQRREFAKLAGAASAAPFLAAAGKKPRVAAIVTEYRHYSHADVIVGRLLGGNSANGTHHAPRTQVVSLYTDQSPQQDMAPDLAARFGFRRFPTIREALTLGGAKLAVDAVCFVGEHGNYPWNDLGQHLYPRYELFNQILDVYESGGRAVPTFFDKHLSYSWQKAKGIYDRAAKLKVPWMAGSSIPVTIRTPLLEIPLETPLEAAAGLGYGPHDAYGFHLLESIQCMLERRAGGETGIAQVEWIENDAVMNWLASENGKWALPLLEEAHARNASRKGPLQQAANKPVLFSLRYKDGLKAVGLILGPSGADWSFACRRKGASSIDSTFFGLSPKGRPLPHFDGMVHCIEDMFVSGKPAYPVERTLLTTGALAFLFESKKQRSAVDTPDLSVVYRAAKNTFFQRA